MEYFTDPLAEYDPLVEHEEVLRRHGGRHGGRPEGILHSSGVIRYRNPNDELGWLVYRGPRYVGRVSPLAVPFVWSAIHRGSVRVALSRDHAVRRLLALDAAGPSQRGSYVPG